MTPRDEAMRRILAALTPRQREAIHRFYVLGQNAAQILQDMSMDASEFEELKSRVKRQYDHRHKGDAN